MGLHHDAHAWLAVFWKECFNCLIASWMSTEKRRTKFTFQDEWEFHVICDVGLRVLYFYQAKNVLGIMEVNWNHSDWSFFLLVAVVYPWQ